MPVPSKVQQLIDIEVAQLDANPDWIVRPEKRVAIYYAFGSSKASASGFAQNALKIGIVPDLSAADRVRARIALAAARRVTPLWDAACQEADANFDEIDQLIEDDQNEATYLAQRQSQPIELMSIYKVPRAYIASHILEMAELALHNQVRDYAALAQEANECWQLYGRPERLEREYFIKWAAQDALYEAIGWAGNNPQAPAEHAILAYAGEFGGGDFWHRTLAMNKERERQFWRWWLEEAIAEACVAE
jgi:hypothetical protein